MVPCFVVKILSHFEFVFVYSKRVYSKFIDLHAANQLASLAEETAVFSFYILTSFVED